MSATPLITEESDFGVPEMYAILDQDEFTDGTISAEERDDWIKEFVDEFKKEREDILRESFWETFSIRMNEMRSWNKIKERETDVENEAEAMKLLETEEEK